MSARRLARQLAGAALFLVLLVAGGMGAEWLRGAPPPASPPRAAPPPPPPPPPPEAGVAATPCQAVTCKLGCPDGFALDASGCPLCKCRAPKPTSPSWPSPRENY